jgi:hypothetical protein
MSDTVYFEISTIVPYRQRHDLREVIEKVSRYMVVTSRLVISVHEIEALLNRFGGARTKDDRRPTTPITLPISFLANHCVLRHRAGAVR